MVERILKKINSSKFELRTVDKENDIVTIKGYKKEELRTIYKELKLRADQSGLQKHKLENDIKKLDVDESKVLREFMEKMIDASKLQQKDKLEEQIRMVKTDLNLLRTQLKEISSSVPEVLRNK